MWLLRPRLQAGSTALPRAIHKSSACARPKQLSCSHTLPPALMKSPPTLRPCTSTSAPRAPKHTAHPVAHDALLCTHTTKQDMREECGKHGPLKRLIIPRPSPTLPNPPGLAKVSAGGGRLCCLLLGAWGELPATGCAPVVLKRFNLKHAALMPRSCEQGLAEHAPPVRQGWQRARPCALLRCEPSPRTCPHHAPPPGCLCHPAHRSSSSTRTWRLPCARATPCTAASLAAARSSPRTCLRRSTLGGTLMPCHESTVSATDDCRTCIALGA